MSDFSRNKIIHDMITPYKVPSFFIFFHATKAKAYCNVYVYKNVRFLIRTRFLHCLAYLSRYGARFPPRTNFFVRGAHLLPVQIFGCTGSTPLARYCTRTAIAMQKNCTYVYFILVLYFLPHSFSIHFYFI